MLTGAGTTTRSGAATPGPTARRDGYRGASGEGNFSAPGTVQGQYGTLTINARVAYLCPDSGTRRRQRRLTYQITDASVRRRRR